MGKKKAQTTLVFLNQLISFPYDLSPFISYRSFCNGHFVPENFVPYYLVPWSSHPLVISSPGHFVPCYINSGAMTSAAPRLGL
jgi:hypothetical protein